MNKQLLGIKINNLITSVTETNIESIRRLLSNQITDVEKEAKGLKNKLAKEQKRLLNIAVDNITYFLTDLRRLY